MKIAIDLQACQTGSSYGGIGRYSLALTKAMARQCNQHELFVVLNGLMPLTEFDVRLELANLVDPANIIAFNSITPDSARCIENIPQRKIAEVLREEFLRRLRPDIIHVSSLVEGWGGGDPAITSVGDASLARKTAVTWYDLIPHVQPEIYLIKEDVKSHYQAKIAELRKAECLLAISKYTKDEVVSQLGIEEDRVVNISGGVDPCFRKFEISTSKRALVCAKWGITRPFLFYTGSFDARKNHAALIRAFAQLPPSVRDKYQLVIAGKGSPKIYHQLAEVAGQLGLPKDRLIFLDHISDEELLNLYNLCHLFVFPSLFEGFGLPPLEAMACGAPVIGANQTSIPEIIGLQEALFDPYDIGSISAKIYQSLTDDQFRQRLIENGRQRVKRFTWDQSAKIALNQFEEIHSRNSLSVSARKRMDGDSESSEYGQFIKTVGKLSAELGYANEQLGEIAVAIESNELITARANRETSATPAKIGWVTTWGSRCRIASYAANLIGSSQDSQITIFADRSNCKTQDEENVIRCWTAGGNRNLNALSAEIEARQIDVIVIQFDFGLFNIVHLNNFIAKHANQGIRVVMILHSAQDSPSDATPNRLLNLRLGLIACSRILVHSAHDVMALRAIEITRNVSILPQGVVAARPTRQDSQNLINHFCISTYVSFFPQSGLLEMIEAIGILAKRYPTIRLQMINPDISSKRSRSTIEMADKLIEVLGLKDNVDMITAYLSDSESLRYLSESDLVVFPCQGSGGSLNAATRMGIASGTPVAVTPLESFDDFREIVLALPGYSPQEMAVGIAGLIDSICGQNDGDIRETLRRAEAWRSKNSFPNVAAQLSELTSSFALRSVVPA